jgi:hypothetical protein
MCTATYFPIADKNSSFVLTHSRDEKAIRPVAHLPQPTLINRQTVLFPQDPQGQGTWIATTDDRTVCLLNGAFVAHQPQYPYRHSRGIVVLDFFEYANPEAFADWYDFRNLEPFTLLVAGRGRLVEIRWNGKRLFFYEKDPKRPHIWSSVTLYAPDVVERREGWFRDWWHKNPEPSVADIRAFHLNAGDNDPTNSIRMNRDGKLFTVSLTSTVHEPNGTTMIYDDFTQPASVQALNSSLYATA